MSSAVVDDHLLRDLLTGRIDLGLEAILADHEPATTNLYLLRLCKSVSSATGGALTGSLPAEVRSALGRRLVALPDEIMVIPMRELAFRMAEIAGAHRLSTLGAEAVAAAERLEAPLCVWAGDDGPHIRAAMNTFGEYQTIYRDL
ncbi:MAG: hypothetical protein OXH20_07285 [bacterium]|nr:hypothetical protein [bacterium]MDE0669518.1 hypothetical protein [bacterium]MXZ29553.1 hypothetical protein [Acidimicrobiia bacterium]MYE67959.1 hypothetical protein [Acidimicrobiia bacterium]MYJ13296.1 hypothetical protein [Acidimicrobiia bacterium]